MKCPNIRIIGVPEEEDKKKGHAKILEVSNVQNVPKHLTIAHFLLNIREFTLERNLINVQNVAKPLTTTQTSFNIGEFIWERSLTNVQNVAKPLSVPHI